MNSSPTEEIKQIRHELGRQAGFSVSRIFADLRYQRQNSARKYIEALTTHAVESAANNCVDRSGESPVSEFNA